MTVDISIIMATYNREAFIVESLKAIQNQSFTKFECLIIDDGGTDNTYKIIEPLLKEDKRFKYLNRKAQYSKGLPGCRNMGIDMAKGRYIVFFDDDDIAHPDTLKIATEHLENSALDYCRYLRSTFTGHFDISFDRNTKFKTKLLNKNTFKEMIPGKVPFNSCQVLWKKDCFTKNHFNEKLMYAEEWECYSRILIEGAIGVSVEKVLYYGRKHPNSNTGEFWNADPVRMNSKIEASKLVIENLEKNQSFNAQLQQYFFRLGFLLNEKEIIDQVLKVTNAGTLKRLKYRLGFYFYPVLRPVLRLKSKI
jgi:GalNAc5-diNAcBac-PP-undecaprenol beta-1,3-glucosyltransferase